MHLVRGSVLVGVAVALNGLGGFSFWALLARVEPAPEVGQAQGLFTAVLVVTYLTSLGLPVAVARFSCDRSTMATAFFRAALVATAVSSIAGALALASFGSGSRLLDPLATRSSPAAGLVLGLVTIGLSCAVLVEVRLMALRRWGWVVGRVVFVVLVRFPLLAVVPDDDPGYWAFLLVAGVPAATGLVGAVLLWSREPVTRPGTQRMWEWIRYSAVNHLGLLGAQGPQFLVPLVVALRVSNAEFAPFYLAWGATAIVFVIPHMAGQTLLTESAKQGADRIQLTRHSLLMALGATAMISTLSFGAGPVVHAVLGSDYRSMSELLPLLLGACVPWSVTAIALADARARSTSRAVITLTLAFFGSTLIGVAVGTTGSGVSGAAAGWLVANVVVGLFAGRVLLASLGGSAELSPILDASPTPART